MKEETMHRLIELEEIHLQLHCAVESVRQSWVAMTQGGTANLAKMITTPYTGFTAIFPSRKSGCTSGKKVS